MSQNINELLGASMSKVREMVDANTVVGSPIQLEEGITLIPISKISFGLASGGSDIPNKAANPAFGGGAGCGGISGAAGRPRAHAPHCRTGEQRRGAYGGTASRADRQNFGSCAGTQFGN